MSENQIERGCIGVVWHNEYQYLPYQYFPVDSAQLDTYVKQGYESVKSFTAETYTDQDNMPQCAKNMERVFGLYDQRYEFFRARPLDIAPPYHINVNHFCQVYNIDKHDVWHSVVMLDNWKPGQYIEINGKPFCQWKAGDWFKWKNTPLATFAYANVCQYNFYLIKITGKSTYTGQLNDLFTIEFPEKFDDSKASHPFFANSIIPEINPTRQGGPCAVYMDNGYIKQLDDLKVSDHARLVLNDRGLNIYLFEPMCSYYVDQEPVKFGTHHTQGFYSEFSYPYTIEKLRAEELDAILNFHKRVGLDPKTITVHTGEYNIAGMYPYYENELNLVCDDLYLRTQRPVNELYVNTKVRITKHFISLNWRFTKHRQLLANFLAGENGNLSWYFKNEFEILNQGLWFDLESWQVHYTNLYNQLKRNNENILLHSPYIVDKSATEAKLVKHHHHVDMWPAANEYEKGNTPSLWNTKFPDLQNSYAESFVDIVTETRFAQPTGNYSEKLLQPIQYMKPFILLAPPHTLEYLKESGYLTFDQWWDESYDEEEDHGIRLAKIFTVIRQILNYNEETLNELYQEMMPILEYNSNLYKQLTKHPNWTDSENG